ncbi:phage holin family protein [Streptomyces sp.]|uniref:phage holin family protein n=1 Tax=Streptomyces sp. TaxID=1931 RepID=UPI002F3F55B2
MSPEHNGDGRSLGQLFASATAEMSALVHDEIALAKAELRQDAKRAGFGSAAIVGALAVMLFAMPMLSMAAAYGIRALGLTLGWSFLVVGAAYVMIALVLGLFAYGRFRKVKKPERSIASARKSAAVLQKAKPHPRPLEAQSRALEPAEAGSSAPGTAVKAKV